MHVRQHELLLNRDLKSAEWMFWISAILRFIQGTLCLAVTIFIIVKSSDVINRFKDFASLSLIAFIDNAG